MSEVLEIETFLYCPLTHCLVGEAEMKQRIEIHALKQLNLTEEKLIIQWKLNT